MGESITLSQDFKDFDKILGYNREMVFNVIAHEGEMAVRKAERYIIKELAVHKKTGRREKSIFWEVVKEGARWFFRVASDDPAAPYLEFGTRGPYEIRPKNPNGWLVFFWRKLNRTVFAKKVTHPGIKATPAFSDAHIRFFVGLPGRIVNSIKARAAAGGK